jgi:hypothetical protein
MTPSQARAARAGLKLTMGEVAAGAGVTPNTVQRLEVPPENGRGANTATVAAVRDFYEKSGVTFLDADERGPGVRIAGA